MAAIVSAPKPAMGQVSRPSKLTGAAALCGGIAGCAEALVCHPLDTIKVRLQTAQRGAATSLSHVLTTPGLYRGLPPVLVGIVPKMAVRFASFDAYSRLLEQLQGGQPHSPTALPGRAGAEEAPASRVDSAGPLRVLAAGMLAGVTEAVLVVTPSDVLKIRMQTTSQPGQAGQTLAGALGSILRVEGPRALWAGVGLTAARQGTNQAVNFFAYVHIKEALLALVQKHDPTATALPAWQTAAAGFLSGSMGPLANAPIDTIKTRIQKQPLHERQMQSVWQLARALVATEGFGGLYRGVSARILRVGLGQSVTFCAYEMLRAQFGI